MPAITLPVRIAAEICEPSDAPTERTSVLKPVASPVSDCGTASKIRLGMAAKASPIPIESRMFQAIIAPWVPWSTPIANSATAEISAPADSGSLPPKRRTSTPANGPATSIASAPGSISRPAPVASRPKPYPVDSGASASCGIRMKEPNMPKPTSSVAMFVISTGGRPSSRTSASGCTVRFCSATQPARITAPAPISTSVRALPQPHALARAIASSGSTRPSASTSAPRTSIRPGWRLGDSGISTCVSTAATAAIAAPSQKIQW